MSEPNCSTCKFWNKTLKTIEKNLHRGDDDAMDANVTCGWCEKDRLRRAKFGSQLCDSYEPRPQCQKA
jgi:hypothetical protein